MPLFDVTHIIGVQGYGEQEILTKDVEARNALEAIFKVAPPKCRAWTSKARDWDTAALFNPVAPNRSEEYCDYYYAKLKSI
jgi:hypothetical protein